MKEKEEKVYPEEDMKKKKTPEEIEEEMDSGEKEEDVYSEEGREKLVEDAEISSAEEAFARGEEEAKKYKRKKE